VVVCVAALARSSEWLTATSCCVCAATVLTPRRVHLPSVRDETLTPLRPQVPVAAANGRVLGHLEFALSVHYLPVVTSFEMNEHLAATDTSLPLYPGPGHAPRRIFAAPAEQPVATAGSSQHEQPVATAGSSQHEQPVATAGSSQHEQHVATAGSSQHEQPVATAGSSQHEQHEQQQQRPEPAAASADVFVKLGEFLDRRHSRRVPRSRIVASACRAACRGASSLPPAASGRETGLERACCGLASVHRLPRPRRNSSGIASHTRLQPRLTYAACGACVSS
jgi:hypothetical protein